MFDHSHTSHGARVLLVLASLVIVIAGLKAASSIVVPLLMAVFTAIIALAPLQWLRQRGAPLWLAMTVVLAFLIAFLVVIGSLIGASVNQMTSALPRYEAQLVQLIDNSAVWLAKIGIDLPAGGVVGLINPSAAAKFFGRMVSGFGGLLANSMLIVFAALFILMESTTIPNKLRSMLSQPDETLIHLAGFMESVKQYLVIKAIMSLITGGLITVYLLILGTDFAVLWGALAFFMNFVPYIGSIIAAVPAVILALLDGGPGPALAVAAGFVVANVAVGNILEPRYMGRGLGLSTLVVFLSLLFWGWVFGPVGMFLSAPLTMLVKIALERDPRSQWISVLLSAQAPPSKS
mgnify:FL=1